VIQRRQMAGTDYCRGPLSADDVSRRPGALFLTPICDGPLLGADGQGRIRQFGSEDSAATLTSRVNDITDLYGGLRDQGPKRGDPDGKRAKEMSRWHFATCSNLLPGLSSRCRKWGDKT